MWRERECRTLARSAAAEASWSAKQNYKPSLLESGHSVSDLHASERSRASAPFVSCRSHFHFSFIRAGDRSRKSCLRSGTGRCGRCLNLLRRNSPLRIANFVLPRTSVLQSTGREAPLPGPATIRVPVQRASHPSPGALISDHGHARKSGSRRWRSVSPRNGASGAAK